MSSEVLRSAHGLTGLFLIMQSMRQRSTTGRLSILY
jgi:hypothetical protein